MNELTKFLVESILNETTEKVVALFGGGFKPPTKGHLDVVNQGIKQNPEVSEVKILVGGGERNGFTQDQAVKIWNLYNDIGFINKPATIIPVSSPFTYYKNYLKDNPDDKVYVFIGSRPDDEKDQMDVKQRSEFVKKYSDNVIPVEVSTTGGVSGTLARKLFKTDIDGFRNMFPENLLDIDFQKILDILNNKSTGNTQKSALKSTEPLTPLDEAIIGDKIECDSCGWSWKIIDGGDDLFTCHKCWHDNTPTLNEADPKKGTGKKPKGSGRRLYTDEDPKDTVGIKFSTRQDIVDTLNKKSFKAKSHARQSQIINLIHQRVRAAYGRAKDPAVKKRLKTGLDYITDKKEASKKKTQRLKNQKENIDPKSQSKHKGKSAPFGSAYEPVDEGDTYEKMAAKGKKAGSLKQGTVRKRLKIPKDKKIPLSKINKEISRLKKMDKDKDKKGVQLGDKNQKYYKALQLSKTLKTTTNVNENATYSSKIDYKQQIKDLTKHMIKKGMNILPLPRVIFKHGDQENASQFLGKTAYYTPSDMTVVLYTEGRHPKDIVRSFAHEMIHHIQNLEDRLENISTTNTMEDDNLNDIEREAYTKGNMVFRNWTDNMDGEEVSSLSEIKKEVNSSIVAVLSRNGNQISLYDFDNKEPLGLINTYGNEVTGVAAKKGYGPLMYELGMANVYPNGLQSDRNGNTEPAAEEVLNKFIEGASSNIKVVKLTPKDKEYKTKYPNGNEVWNVDGFYNHKFYNDDTSTLKQLLQKGNELYPKEQNQIISDTEEMYDSMVNEEVSSLNEGPQFGILYHYTEYLSDVLDDNILRGPISLTRSRDSFVKDWIGSVPILVLDKDKLRNNYKIRPYQSYDDDGGSEDEMEEVIDRNVTNLSKYIVKVILPKPNEEYENALKEKGIPYEIDKPLNEKKKPYKHKSGFNDKLGKDPFGLNQYARELMEEFQIEDIKPATESLEKQEEVRIFNPNCGCDKT